MGELTPLALCASVEGERRAGQGALRRRRGAAVAPGRARALRRRGRCLWRRVRHLGDDRDARRGERGVKGGGERGNGRGGGGRGVEKRRLSFARFFLMFVFCQKKLAQSKRKTTSRVCFCVLVFEIVRFLWAVIFLKPNLVSFFSSGCAPLRQGRACRGTGAKPEARAGTTPPATTGGEL